MGAMAAEGVLGHSAEIDRMPANAHCKRRGPGDHSGCRLLRAFYRALTQTIIVRKPNQVEPECARIAKNIFFEIPQLSRQNGVLRVAPPSWVAGLQPPILQLLKNGNAGFQPLPTVGANRHREMRELLRRPAHAARSEAVCLGILQRGGNLAPG